MKLSAMALAGLMMCGCAWGQNIADGRGQAIKDMPTTKGNCFSISECSELHDKEVHRLGIAVAVPAVTIAKPFSIPTDNFHSSLPSGLQWVPSPPQIASPYGYVVINGDFDIVVKCDVAIGDWGDPKFSATRCHLEKENTLDDLVTAVSRIMAADEKHSAMQIAELRHTVVMLCAMLHPVKPRPMRKKPAKVKCSDGVKYCAFYYLQDDGSWGLDKYGNPATSRAMAKKASVTK